MSNEVNNPGRLDAQAYKADPDNVDAPTSSHQQFDRGTIAETLIAQGSLEGQMVSVQLKAPTTDQKAALDAANSPNASNAFATAQDITDQTAATQETFTLKADAGRGSAYDTLLVSQAMNTITDISETFEGIYDFYADDEIDGAWTNTDTKTFGLTISAQTVLGGA